MTIIFWTHASLGQLFQEILLLSIEVRSEYSVELELQKSIICIYLPD